MNRQKLSLAIGMLIVGLSSHDILLAESNLDNVDSAQDSEQQFMQSDNDQFYTQKKQADKNNLKHFVSESDIALWGTVANIEYKLSEKGDDGQAEIPYTFVTYDVKENIHGNIESKQVVLRFIGGLDEKTMRYMGASNVPNFDMGDEDILFVQGNSESMSPLVFNDLGRFRVVGGNVFSDTGRALTLNKKGQLKYGKRHRLDEVMTTTVSGSQGTMVMKHKISPDAVQQTGDSISAIELVKQIRKMAIPSRANAKFVNADINMALKAPDMKSSQPPKIQAHEKVSAQDPQETSESIGEMTTKRRSGK